MGGICRARLGLDDVSRAIGEWSGCLAADAGVFTSSSAHAISYMELGTIRLFWYLWDSLLLFFDNQKGEKGVE